MSETSTPTLTEAVAVVEKLSEEEQAIVAAEMLVMVKEGVLPPERSPEDQAIIKERLSRPLKIAPREEVLAVLRKYNPAI